MIGIIGAMDEEVVQIKAEMQDTEVYEKASMEFISGRLHGRKVVVVKSGIGKVNAAVCAQILSDIFEVEAIINTGIAGSLDAKINIGDIVLSEDALQHDMDAEAFGYEPGQIPRMDTLSFEADKRLIDIAQKCCMDVCSDIKAFCGRVVSGDQFISDKGTKDRIHEMFGGLCTEMEGAAIAQTAYLNKIPFLIIRAISDKADDSASLDYPAFEKKAIQNSVKLLNAIIKEY